MTARRCEGDPVIRELKTQAWALKKAAGLTQAQALDAIAQNKGHANWMRLLQAHKGSEELTCPP